MNRFVTDLGKIVAVAAALALAALPASAQTTGTVAGSVTDAANAAGLQSVQVHLVGTGLGGLTNASGRFLIVNVPAGNYTLRAERLGYATAEAQITVAAGGTVSQDFAMMTEALGLDELVVTGTAGASRRREIGNTVAQINLSDVTEPPQSVDALLQGRVSGMTVLNASGNAGSGARIRLRGNVSIAQSNQPLIYVDGVRLRSDAFDKNVPPTGYPGRSGNDVSSPLNNINPADIDRIEVIKGAAATTLYGTEASAGVIQIFTKRGHTGAAQWTASVEQGVANMRPFGVSSDRRPSFEDAESAAGGTSDFMFIDPWLRNAWQQRYTLSVSGGSEDVQYFVSGAIEDDEGVLPNDNESRANIRGNFTFSPADNLQLQWNTAFTKHEFSNTAAGNNAHGLTLNVFRRNANYFGNEIKENLDLLLGQDITTDIDQLITGGTATWTPLANFTNRLSVGYDLAQQDNRNLRPFGFVRAPDGILSNGRSRFETLTFDYVGTFNFDVGADINSSFSFGGQSVTSDIRRTTAYGEDFPGPGAPTVTTAGTKLGFEQRERVVNAGFFFQNVLDVSNRYFVTLGVRVDGNSAFGSGFGLQAYPKASLSWVLSDEDFYPEWGEFKLRGALGQSGRAPGAFDAVRTWSPEGLAGIPAFVPENVGNDDIGPEVTTEVEGGFDASWLNNRLSTSFTYYRQITDEALFNVPQIPSGGFTNSQLTNIGKLKNSGIEAQVDATVFENASWGVDLGVNVSTNNSEILELNDPNLETACFKVGYPLRARCNQKVANPDQLVDDFSEVLFVEPGDPDFQGDGDAANQYLYGPNLPTTFISPSLTVRAPRGITVSARGDYKGGFYMNEQVFPIGRSVRSPLCYPYYSDPANSNAVNTQIPAIWMARCGSTSQQEGYMWDASFFKLRSVSATVPVDFAFPDQFGSAVLTMSLNNSFLWMKEMPFMDPETSADPTGPDGAQQGYNFEETVPAPITFRMSLRVTF